MKNLGIAAIVVGIAILLLCLLGVVGTNPRGLVAAAVVILAAGLILYRRGRPAGPRSELYSRKEHPMSQRTTKGRRQESPVTEVFFAGGAILVVIGLMYSLAKSWPSIDPLALATLVGIGLLLVVVCERLGLIIRELRKITALMQRAVSESDQVQ